MMLTCPTPALPSMNGGSGKSALRASTRVGASPWPEASRIVMAEVDRDGGSSGGRPPMVPPMSMKAMGRMMFCAEVSAARRCESVSRRAAAEENSVSKETPRWEICLEPTRSR